MRLETAINKKNQAFNMIKTLFREASIFKMKHFDILNRYLKIKNNISKCPVWVKSEVDGYYTAKSEGHMELMDFCYRYNGQLYSTHKNRVLNTEHFYSQNKDFLLALCESGFYYKNTDKKYF